ALGIDLSYEFFDETFTRAGWALVKISVDHDFVTGRLETAQPGNKFSILHRSAVMMVIRHDQKRAMTDSFLGELRKNFVRSRLGRWRDVVNRNDKIIFGRTRRRDDGQKLRGHSRGHFAKFSTPGRVRTS